MGDLFDVTVLSVLQGVAEFLPISSSGHLVIGQHLLKLNAPGMRLDVFLHVGTLAAVFLYYRAVIVRLVCGLCVGGRDAWEFAGKIILSALPAIAVYACLHARIDALFENAHAVGALLMFTGAVLCTMRFVPVGTKNVSFIRALLMGIAQAVALLPGVSRSGMTLVAARSERVEAGAAAEFSFLMSAPLILGGAFLEFFKTPAMVPGAAPAPELSWSLIAYGSVLAAIVGYVSLALLVRALKSRYFWFFGPYCLIAGLLTLHFC